MKTNLLRFWLTALVILVSAASYAYDVCIDGIYYNLCDSKAEVTYNTKYSSNYSGEITIPSSINIDDCTYEVDAIGEYAFYGSRVTTVNLPESILSIGVNAFRDCKDLSTLQISKGVKAIDVSAFFNCKSLTLEIDENNQSFYIDNGVLFSKDKSILYYYPESRKETEYTIPENVICVGRSAFHDSNVSIVHIPGNLQRIEDYAFYGSKLSDIELPNTVCHIGEEAFSVCKSLTSFVVPELVDSLKSTFRLCENLTSLVVGRNVRYFDKNAFFIRNDRASRLNIVFLPLIEPTIPVDAGRYASLLYPKGSRYDYNKLCYSYWTYSHVTIGNFQEHTYESALDVHIPSYGFAALQLTVALRIPQGIKAYVATEYNAKEIRFSRLEGDIIPARTSVLLKGDPGVYTFPAVYETDVTASSVLPCFQMQCINENSGTYKMTQEENYSYFLLGEKDSEVAFYDDSDNSMSFYDYAMNSSILKDGRFKILPNNPYIEIENSLVETNKIKIVIEENIFNISAVSDDETTGTVAGAGEYEEGTEVTLTATPAEGYEFIQWSDGCTENPYTFTASENMSLTATFSNKYVKLTFADGSTRTDSFENGNIPANQYKDNTEIVSAVLSEGITSVGYHAFDQCSSLTSINIPEGVTTIDDRAFFGCSSLTSVIIPESVTTIGVYVFQGCSSLTSVTIPESVTTIDPGAFEGCTSLTSVNITNLEAWCKIIFYSGSNPLYYAHHLFLNGEEVKDLIIPESVTTIGRNAFDGCTSLISITIPESVTTIDDGAFRGCTQLYEVINHSHLPIIAGSDTYGGVAKYAKNVYSDALEEVSLVAADDPDHEITDDYTQVVTNYDQDWVHYTTSYDLQEHLAVKFGDENAVSITDMPEGYSVRYTFAYGDVSYFTPITADGKLSPQLPNGKPATTACVGKNAIWRIEIMYGDDVVEVGYYKVTITGEAVIETAPAVVAEDILKVTCDPTDVALNRNLSLDSVWNKIVEVTGEDLDVVKDKYSISMTSEGNVAQFTEYEAEGERTLYKLYKGKGDIKLNADGSVNWNVRDSVSYVGSELRSLSTDVVKSMTTYIRVRSNEAISKDTYNEFYLPLTWAPQPIEHWGEYQELSWTYTRVANQWQYNRSTREEAELRLYADLTKTGTTPFTYNIAQKAMKNFDYTMLDFVGTAKDFVNVQNGNIVPVDGHFRFIEHPNPAARKMIVNGDTYNFTVSADGKQLRAAKGTETPVVIATITEQGVVNLVNNTTSQLLLNAYENNQLDYGQTLCARVGFAASCCAGVVKVIDGDFDVRFIRPIAVNAADINISDAEANENIGAITTSILNNIVCFNNYTLADRPNYIETFGARIELGNVADWKTNYNAAADDFTKTLAQNYITDLFAKNAAKGEITYFLNVLPTKAFSVLVPVTVNYDWGSVSQTIKINIPESTTENTDITRISHAIYAEDVDVLVGKSKVLPICLKNTASITSFQFDLRLPEGVTIATDSYGDADIQLATERTTLARHSLSYNEQSNGDMRVVCTSLKNATFSGNDGNVVLVRLNIAEGMEEGDYPIVLSNIEMSEPNMTKHKVPLYTSKLHIDDYLLGDMDGDREVTVTDVTGVVNIILGIPMTGANEKAADVSGDGEVTVTDATGVVNIILGIPNGYSARRAPRTTEAALNVAPFNVIAGETVEVPIVLQSGADEFNGMQFDLVLPAGLRLIDVAADRRHNADFATRCEGTERIVSLSLSNATYAGNGTAALTLTLATDSDVEGGNILLCGIELVRPDLSNVRLDALSAPFAVAGTTGINLPTSHPDNLKTSIYDLQGRKTRGVVKGVYMQNRQKVIK